MVIFLGLLCLLEVAYFIGVLLYDAAPPSATWPTSYLQGIKITLSAVYGINILAFIPLFIIVMVLLHRQFISLFSEIKVKVLVIFIVFLAVTIFRFLCYMSLQFKYISFLEVEQVQSEIPFYISEIAIALCFMYFLVRLYTRQMDQVVEELKEEEEARHGDSFH